LRWINHLKQAYRQQFSTLQRLNRSGFACLGEYTSDPGPLADGFLPRSRAKELVPAGGLEPPRP
jgi:hypothetical protein